MKDPENRTFLSQGEYAQISPRLQKYGHFAPTKSPLRVITSRLFLPRSLSIPDPLKEPECKYKDHFYQVRVSIMFQLLKSNPDLILIESVL